MPNIDFFPQEHRYLVDGTEYPSVTQILSPITDTHYSAIAPAVLEYAARRGTMVHELTEAIDLTDEMPDDEDVPMEVEPYINAYMNFKLDYAPKFLHIEHLLYNGDLGYCGTVDRVAEVCGKIWVIDLKTTGTPTKENKISLCCQTLAYSLAMDYPNVVRKGLYLTKDGEYKLFDCAKFETEYGFSSMELLKKCVDLWQAINGIHKIKGE